MNNVSGASVLPDLQQLPEDETLQSVMGDGAYDARPVYEAIMRREASIVILPERMRACARRVSLNAETQLLLHASV